MPASLAQAKAGNSGSYETSYNFTFDNSTVSGNTLIVAISYNNDQAGTASVSDNKGNTWNKRTGGDSGGDTEGEVWVAENITGGASHQITVTFSANYHDSAFAAMEWSGLATASFDQKAEGAVSAGTSHTSASTPTTTQADELVIGAMALAANSTFSLGSGFSNLYNANGSDLYEAVAIESKIVSSTGTQQALITSGTSSVGYFMCLTFKIASSATIEQEGFAFGDDDGNEATHTLDTQDSNVTAPLGTKTLRMLLDGTGDPASKAFKLKYQKNGSGGYVDVPVVSTTTTAPTVEAGDCTESGNDTATTSWAVSYPAYVSGDLLIFHVASDANVTHDWPATGPNGETVNTIADSTGGTAQRASGFWFVGSATTGAGTLTVTPSASEQWTACVLKVPAGEFNSTTPIQTNVGTANDTTADTAWATPAWTSDATANGRVICFAAHDVVTTSATPSGWTTLVARDRGACGLTLAARDAANTASESIASASFTKTSETDSSFGYVINGVVVTNQVYISTSANVTAGGENTTARLTAPSGKTTSDFDTGRRWDDENGSDSIDITADDYTELEWVLTTQSPAATSDYYEFRVYDGDTALDTYTLTPKWTIGTATGTNTQINIGDSWKTVNGMQINIGDAWKTVSSVSINIGDSWKTVF